MNLAYKYPIIFWNCACLINDSGGAEEEIDETTAEELKVEPTYYNEMEEFTFDDKEEDVDDTYDEEDCDGYPVEVCKMKDGKKKKKSKTTNYGKIATAIGKMRMAGIEITPPDINKSTYTFSPDMDTNTIRYGISGISRIGEDLIREIIANRPYNSLEDFLNKIKITKPQMINLIKSGAFDCFGERVSIMHQYINMISDVKKRITLQNMKMLIDFNLIPTEYSMVRRVYNFTKYIKKKEFKYNENYLIIDNIAYNFIEQYFDVDILEPCAQSPSGFMINKNKWENIYQSYMDKVRPFIKSHNQELLDAVNNKLTEDVWNKYCSGNISKWEMDSVSFYSHNHELAAVDPNEYGWVNFFELDETPEIERVIPIKGKQVPIFRLFKIAGTVLDRDKAKKTITLLTTEGVVPVKAYGVFEQYDKQISQKGPDGKKHIIEKSMFTRGNKIIVTGIRQEEAFVAKTYAKTPWHRIEQITDIDEAGHITIKAERASA